MVLGVVDGVEDGVGDGDIVVGVGGDVGDGDGGVGIVEGVIEGVGEGGTKVDVEGGVYPGHMASIVFSIHCVCRDKSTNMLLYGSRLQGQSGCVKRPTWKAFPSSIRDIRGVPSSPC